MTEYRFLHTVTPEQEAELVALYREAGWITPDECGSFVSAAVAGSFRFLVARDDAGKIVGMARALSDGVSDAYIQDVAVSGACRHCGIGRELVRRLAAELKQCGIDWIGLVGVPGSEEFYRKCGLEPQPEHTLYRC